MAHTRHMHRRSPKWGCYSTLTIAILPLAISILQILGKASIIAACGASVLIVLKIVVEWRHYRHITLHTSSIRQTAPAPLAGCFLCHKHRPLRIYRFSDLRIGICMKCYSCLLRSQA